jgi:proline dehydrogenase
MSGDDRWSLQDLDQVVAWCRQRNAQGIRCTVSPLAEYAENAVQVDSAVEENILCIRTLARQALSASVSVKPTSLGILFDRAEYFRNLTILFHEAGELKVKIEIDMEGRDYVEDTLQSARVMAEEHQEVTLALQAYLYRTSSDCDLCTSSGIRIRLVKGTYQGDIMDFTAIQERLKSLIGHVAGNGRELCVGTHDPEIIAWIQTGNTIKKEQVELGFLKGLSDSAKLRLASSGWKVSEYVPYGTGGEAYKARRENYLFQLEMAGRHPAP